MADKKGGDAKKKKSYKVHKIYTNGKAKNKACPKCGQGFFLAQHKDRITCGKCHYSEFSKKQ